jgi:hypothetical protein
MQVAGADGDAPMPGSGGGNESGFQMQLHTHHTQGRERGDI